MAELSWKEKRSNLDNFIIMAHYRTLTESFKILCDKVTLNPGSMPPVDILVDPVHRQALQMCHITNPR
jgi:hypothetical protein